MYGSKMVFESLNYEKMAKTDSFKNSKNTSFDDEVFHDEAESVKGFSDWIDRSIFRSWIPG